MYLLPPFALFVLDGDITVEFINDSLTRAHNGYEQTGWDLWVATDDYNDIPKLRSSGIPPSATEPPLPDSFTSPWIGKTIEDCAAWLQHVPNDAAMTADYFLVMDEYSIEDGTVIVCCVKCEGENGCENEGGGEFDGKGDGKGDSESGGECGVQNNAESQCNPTKGLKVEYFPQTVEEVSMSLWTNGSEKWDEKATCYQASRMAAGKPDISELGDTTRFYSRTCSKG